MGTFTDGRASRRKRLGSRWPPRDDTIWRRGDPTVLLHSIFDDTITKSRVLVLGGNHRDARQLSRDRESSNAVSTLSHSTSSMTTCHLPPATSRTSLPPSCKHSGKQVTPRPRNAEHSTSTPPSSALSCHQKTPMTHPTHAIPTPRSPSHPGTAGDDPALASAPPIRPEPSCDRLLLPRVARWRSGQPVRRPEPIAIPPASDLTVLVLGLDMRAGWPVCWHMVTRTRGLVELSL